jgi:hypothetical protein
MQSSPKLIEHRSDRTDCRLVANRCSEQDCTILEGHCSMVSYRTCFLIHLKNPTFSWVLRCGKQIDSPEDRSGMDSPLTRLPLKY